MIANISNAPTPVVAFAVGIGSVDRRVHFSDTVTEIQRGGRSKCLPIPEELSFLENEWDPWYKKEDFEEFKRERRLTINYLKKAAAVAGTSSSSFQPRFDGESFCCRGLEAKLTRDARFQTTMARYKVITGVLEEQDRQVESGKFSVDRIKSVAQEHSMSSVRQAIERALDDEKEAKKAISDQDLSMVLEKASDLFVDLADSLHNTKLLSKTPAYNRFTRGHVLQ